jgi:hypothetical protein
LTSSEGGHQTTKLINDTHMLWSDREDKTCPNLIPFSYILPSSYKNGDSQQSPLPPSYTSTYAGAYTLFVGSHYSINVYVERARHHMVGRLLSTINQYESHNLFPPLMMADRCSNSLVLGSPSRTTHVLVHTAPSFPIQTCCLP